MKRMLCMLTVAVVLMGVLLTGASASGDFADQIAALNDSHTEYAGMMLELFFSEYETADESSKALYASLIHNFYGIYDSAYNAAYPLKCYSLLKMTGSASSFINVSGEPEVFLDQIKLDKWGAYVKGEIGADEYVKFVKGMYQATKEAEKIAEDMKKTK